MHRNPLKNLLKKYRRQFPQETMTTRFIHFVDTHENCFERSLEKGHVTASAWTVDPKENRSLLIHHKKLGQWLQPGGHCDGNPDVVQVARREVQEETGLQQFDLMADSIYDLDIHPIPAWGKVPPHLHYDVRFLIHCSSRQSLIVSDESSDIRWFSFSEIENLSSDGSILRMLRKTSP